MTCNYCGKSVKNKFCNGSCASLFYWSKNNNIEISQELHEIIEGTLFSDAGLELNNKNGNINPRYYFKQSSKSYEYVKYVACKFKLETNIKLFKNLSGLNRDIITYDNRFRTKSSPDLLSYYNRWYNNGKKIIPKDFTITPNILLHAYLGDGYMYNRKSYYGKYKSPCQILCTDCFNIEDVTRFIDLLESVDINAYIRWTRYDPKGYPRVVIRRNSFNRFFEYIGKCPVKCFEYKWNST